MPLAERIELAENAFIAAWELNETPEELESVYRLKEGESEIYSSFTHPWRKSQWLATRLLLEQILPGSKIIYDANGKPWSDREGHFISITHSAAYIAIMVSFTPCGIDLEQIREKIDRIAPRFLDEKELEAARLEPAVERMHIYWCVKEAIYKVYGRKEVSFRTDIFVDKVTSVPEGKTTASLRVDGEWKKQTVYYRPFRECMMAWVKS
jgi:phosphopantetheinyl transferase